MATNAIENNPELGNAGAAPTQGNNKLGKNEFLKLLMTQLGNQDPTSPASTEQFVTQLATFASLELQQNSNDQLENLLLAQASSNQTAMSTFVGKDIVYRTDSLMLEAGKPALGEAQLASKAEKVTVVVQDANGKPVRTMQMGSQEAGAMTINWDGRDDQGRSLPAGKYKLQVTASDTDGKSIAVDQRGRGHVSGVSFEGGVAQARVGDMLVKIPDIVEIQERTTP
jgi:flagellar basal-body rod modification protein FlgD